MNYAVFPHTVTAHSVSLAVSIKNELSMLPEMTTWFLPPTPLMHLQDTYINDKHLVSALLCRLSGVSKVGQE